ncbi:hypothetical protein C8F01DRAFT_463048 [Mycena amicta]|nr:hypothetical protein C8F01DRAFT_463048 [Mycena amicta]
MVVHEHSVLFTPLARRDDPTNPSRHPSVPRDRPSSARHSTKPFTPILSSEPRPSIKPLRSPLSTLLRQHPQRPSSLSLIRTAAVSCRQGRLGTAHRGTLVELGEVTSVHLSALACEMTRPTNPQVVSFLKNIESLPETTSPVHRQAASIDIRILGLASFLSTTLFRLRRRNASAETVHSEIDRLDSLRCCRLSNGMRNPVRLATQNPVDTKECHRPEAQPTQRSDGMR